MFSFVIVSLLCTIVSSIVERSVVIDPFPINVFNQVPTKVLENSRNLQNIACPTNQKPYCFNYVSLSYYCSPQSSVCCGDGKYCSKGEFCSPSGCVTSQDAPSCSLDKISCFENFGNSSKWTCIDSTSTCCNNNPVSGSCPNGGSCQSGSFCCKSGFNECSSGCMPVGAECCGDGTYCPSQFSCSENNKCVYNIPISFPTLSPTSLSPMENNVRANSNSNANSVAIGLGVGGGIFVLVIVCIFVLMMSRLKNTDDDELMNIYNDHSNKNLQPSNDGENNVNEYMNENNFGSHEQDENENNENKSEKESGNNDFESERSDDRFEFNA